MPEGSIKRSTTIGTYKGPGHRFWGLVGYLANPQSTRAGSQWGYLVQGTAALIKLRSEILRRHQWMVAMLYDSYPTDRLIAMVIGVITTKNLCIELGPIGQIHRR